MPHNYPPGYGPHMRPPPGPPPPPGNGGPYQGGYNMRCGYNPYNRPPPPTGYPGYSYGQNNGYPPHPPSYDYQQPPVPDRIKVSLFFSLLSY